MGDGSGTVLFLHGLTIDGRDGAVLARALPERVVIAPDLPGHGKTAPVDDWSLRALASWVAEHHPEPGPVVAHSWGAAIAVWLAATAPRRVTSLVLLEGGWFDRADLPRRAPPNNIHHARALEALFAQRTSEAWPLLAAQDIPVLAVAGTLGDDGTKERLLTRFQELVPRAERHVLTTAGHDLLRDAGESTSALVAAFLRGHHQIKRT